MNTTDRAGNPPVAMCTDMLTWIAVEAMKGIIGSYGFDLLPDNQIAQRSFEVATAMLHERTLAFRVGDLTFGTLQEAQEHEIANIIGVVPGWNNPEEHKKVASVIVSAGPKIVDVLKTTPRSHVKARKINGGVRKTRTPRIFTPEKPAA